MRAISNEGVQLIAKFEGYRSKAYKDAAGIWTIGYGHTGYVKFYGENVCADMTITKEQALELLKDDLSKAETEVNKYYSRYTWDQNEFDALVSFAFNVGSINQLTANGIRSRSVIAEKIVLYNKVGEKIVAGLTIRRETERELFLTAINNTSSKKVSSIKADCATTDSTFQVKVTAGALNIRNGPNTSYAIVGSIKDKGIYTIMKTKNNWGYLKSGKGWICLDYTKKV